MRTETGAPLFGIKRMGPVKIGNRSFVIAQLTEEPAAHEERYPMGIEVCRAAAVRKGLFTVSELVPGEMPRKIRLGIIRMGIDIFVIDFERALRIVATTLPRLSKFSNFLGHGFT